jgi:beta-glucosidase
MTAPSIDELLGRLDLAAKVRLLTGADFWSTYPEPAVGLRAMVVSDGPAGVRGQAWDERDTSASLPSPTALAASWDEGLVYRLGGALAAEARRKGVDVVLGPTVNLHRSPLGGRHFECFSEDPLLTARIGTAIVRGLQDAGVGATPKHFVANDSETDRFTVDVRIDERTLRELYLAPFEQIQAAARPWLVMAAYNGVNGATMTESPLLDGVLKGEWGFDGVVVSDWTAVRSTEAAGAAGTDLAMPGPSGPWGDALVAAVRDGRVPEAAIDEKVRRLLRLAARVGALDGVEPATATAPPVVDLPVLLREAAAAGMVLVRNAGGALPLERAALRRVAVLGPNAAVARSQGGGSATVNPAYTVSPLAGLRAAVGPDVAVTHTVGARTTEGLVPVTVDQVTDPATGEPGLECRYLDAAGRPVRTEHRTAGRLLWLGTDLSGVAAVELRARLTARTAGRHQVGVAGVGAYRLEVAGKPVVDEVIAPDSDDLAAAFLAPPQRAAPVELAAGERVDLVLTHQLPAGTPGASVMLGVEEPSRAPDDELAHAVELARAADVAVVVVGTTERIESEGFDRTTLALPGRQDDLVRAVAAANPRTVVVVNSGAPVLLPWRDEVAAVLLSWFPGQEFGNALADVLLGAAEPTGHLPTTWPATAEDVPVLSTTPTDGRLDYAEGLHVGYRAWARATAAPAYPFGHGLGYTTWSYDALEVSGGNARVTVTNTGERTGRQLVQLYLSRTDSAVDRPALWLAGFTTVTAGPGETTTAELTLPAEAFRHWSTAEHGWRVEPGRYLLTAGPSATDRPLTATVDAP